MVLGAVAIVAATCIVVTVTIGERPNFDDPQLVSGHFQGCPFHLLLPDQEVTDNRMENSMAHLSIFVWKGTLRFL